MSSLWSENTVLPAFPALEGDTSTDVLIIGGGMAGLLCALLLKQQGVSCVVAEAGRICSGATKNTTAKITSHHGLIYGRLLREKGEEKAQDVSDCQRDGLGDLPISLQKLGLRF